MEPNARVTSQSSEGKNKGLAKRGHTVAAILLTWSCFPNVDSFCHARNICVRHKVCVLDTKKCFWKSSETFLYVRAARNNVASFCHGRATSQDTCCRHNVSSFCQGLRLGPEFKSQPIILCPALPSPNILFNVKSQAQLGQACVHQTPRKYVFDVTSIGQRSSPWTCKLSGSRDKFQLDCKLHFPSAKLMLRQMHLTNVSESIGVSWLSFDVWRAWIRAIKTALEFVILCSNRWLIRGDHTAKERIPRYPHTARTLRRHRRQWTLDGGGVGVEWSWLAWLSRSRFSP